MEEANIIPQLYVKSRGEQTTKLSLGLTRAPRKCAVRITGGCGKMSADDAEGLYDLYNQALVGFDGVMLFGGTRMLVRHDTREVFPGITEIAPRLRALCPQMMLLGVVPRTRDLGLSDDGMVIDSNPEQPWFTIVHPEQDIVLLVQVSADDPEVWDAEFEECMRITQDLREYAGFTSVLISYNGGTVTKREVLATAGRGWPVVLIRGSGRVTDELANDRGWLAAQRSVVVAEKDAESLRSALATFGAVPEKRLSLAPAKRA